MASIIKNKIFKYLSKFTKGLSTDKINLNTFKGEGELFNLELDENILTDLLELPSWLKITNAWCDHISFRFQWTQLNSVPIYLNLNKVLITIETCEELRSTSCTQGLSSYAGATQYGFIHKVIDGVTVTVNVVNISFKSPAFVASVEIYRIIVQSKSKDWQDCKLQESRLCDRTCGQVLLFKELEWSHAKIEAHSTKDPLLTPLRLITNKAKCRITLKKKLLDSSIMGSRLAFLLDDLLWVLTDFQLRAALHFMDSLVGLIKKSTEITRKKKAARKLETLPEYQAEQSQSTRTEKTASPFSDIFKKYDVVETSYHFQAQKIHLHFSDDPSAGNSCHPELQKGGALQVSLEKLRLDYYPYHLAVAERYHWATYKPAASPHTEWLRQAQAGFTNSLLKVVENCAVPCEIPSNGAYQSNEKIISGGKQNSSLRSEILKQMNKLMTSCIILKIYDFSVYQVSTSCVKKHVPKEFISGEKDRCSLPKSEAVVHAEFTYYYFPGDDPFPLPSPKFYVLLNPIQIHFDVISILWLNSFVLNLYQSLTSQDVSATDFMYFDVKIEALFPRVIVESPIDYPGQKDRPKSLHLQVTRATITNAQSMDRSWRADLEKCIDLYQICSLFFTGEFPSAPDDFPLVPQKFLHRLFAGDDGPPNPSHLSFASTIELKSHLSRELVWTEANDMWRIHLEPVFGDFFGTRAMGKDFPVPFLKAFPLTLWVHVKMPGPGGSDDEYTKEQNADVHVLAHVPTLLSLQLNHYQHLFLLRLFEEMKELTTYLLLDINRITQSVGGSMVVGGVLPELEIIFVMPSQSPGKESSGEDVESVIPDSSSLQDEGGDSHGHFNTSAMTVNHSVLEKCHTFISDFSMETQKVSPEPMPLKTANGNAKAFYSPLKSMSLDCAQPPPSDHAPSFMPVFKKKIDKAIASIEVGSKIPEDRSDNISFRSDMSSDSETFIVLSNEASCVAVEKFEDVMESLFHMNTPENQISAIEIATDVEEENMLTSPSERDSSTSYFKRRELISLTTFKFYKVEFHQQSTGFTSAIKAQVSNIRIEECTSISWDEFQAKFSFRSRDWVEVPLEVCVNPKLKLRWNNLFKSDVEVIRDIRVVDRNHVLKWFEGVVNVELKSLSLSLNTSSLSGLLDLLEDEMAPAPFLAIINLEDIKLRINEDRPPCNITSPEPVSTNFVVTRLTINRLASGVIEIQPYRSLESDKSQNTEISAETANGSRLLKENEELHRQLSFFEGLSKENYQLKKYRQDAEKANSQLRDALNEIESLVRNNKSLSDRIVALENKYQREKNSKR